MDAAASKEKKQSVPVPVLESVDLTAYSDSDEPISAASVVEDINTEQEDSAGIVVDKIRMLLEQERWNTAGTGLTGWIMPEGIRKMKEIVAHEDMLSTDMLREIEIEVAKSLQKNTYTVKNILNPWTLHAWMLRGRETQKCYMDISRLVADYFVSRVGIEAQEPDSPRLYQPE